MLARVAVGQVLKEFRTESSMSYRHLHRKSGISVSHLFDIENGNKEPSSEMLQDFCDALGVSVSDVMIGAAYVLRERKAG